MLDYSNYLILEMAERKINLDFVDRKTVCAVSSIISKNKTAGGKNDNCVSAVPMSRYSIHDLIIRYVTALLLMGKQCPTKKTDIAAIGSFRRYAEKAIQMGATIQDIIDTYNAAAYIPVGKRSKTAKPAATSAQVTTQACNNSVYNERKYIVQYTTKDGDFCSVWVIASDAADAKDQVYGEYWDVNEIISITPTKD